MASECVNELSLDVYFITNYSICCGEKMASLKSYL